MDRWASWLKDRWVCRLGGRLVARQVGRHARIYIASFEPAEGRLQKLVSIILRLIFIFSFCQAQPKPASQCEA